MNTKSAFLSTLMGLTLLFTSCKKDKKLEDVTPTKENSKDSYRSVSDFYQKNGVELQTFTINASTGGNFTTTKGTKVTIPSNCFVNASDVIVSGDVTIQFKDIYSKSDMLLSNVATNFWDGTPLKSGGEFFINAFLNGEALQIDTGKKIDIEQPFQGAAADTAMKAMILAPRKDTLQGAIIGNADAWNISPWNDLLPTTTGYIFSLYEFSGDNGAGTWCNSDNSTYFNAYSKTTLTIKRVDGYSLDVFLIFKGVNSMVHVYTYGTDYPYYYAPLGLECTVVMIGVKDDKFYASFTPITISNYLTVSPTLTEMTTDDFKTKLKALD